MKQFREQAKKDHASKMAAFTKGNTKQHVLSGAHGSLGNPGGNELASAESAPGTRPYVAAEGKATPTRAMQVPSNGKTKQTLGRYARGGGVKKHKAGGTHVNIMVGHPGGGAALAPPPGLGAALAGAGAPSPAMPPRPAGVPAPAGMPGMAGPPGAAPMGAPPMGMRPPGMKRGGGVHSDAALDRAEIKRMVKPQALKKAKGGKVHMTAGSESGPGRLQKVATYGKNAHMRAKSV